MKLDYIFFIKFSINDLIMLLVGIGMGVFLVSIFFLIIFINSVKPRRYIVKSSEKPLTEAEVDDIINFAQESFKDKTLQKDLSAIAHCNNICRSLVKDIASYYFPKSKRPLLELSIDEVIMLSIYISKRVNDLLDRKGIKLLKKIRINTIVELVVQKQKIDNSTVMKTAKKYRFKEAFGLVKNALNILNPLYWARKVVIKTTLNYAINKLCLVVIAITAEETYKIYSKKVFDIDIELNSDYTEEANDITSTLNEVSEEEIEAFDLDTELETNINE